MSLIAMGNAYSIAARGERERLERKRKFQERMKQVEEDKVARTQAVSYDNPGLENAMDSMYQEFNAFAPDNSSYDAICLSLEGVDDKLREALSSVTIKPLLREKMSSLERWVSNASDTLKKTDDPEKGMRFIEKAIPNIYQGYCTKVLGLSGHSLYDRLLGR